MRHRIGAVAGGCLAAILVGSSTGLAQRMERDLEYGPDPKQRLDLSVPASGGYPTIIFVHGGSLTGGDKADEDYANVCNPFPAAGIACANVNYRLAPAYPWPAQAEDVAAAVAWLRANIGQRGGDPRTLFLVGHSSGATLVALVGTDESYLELHKLKLSDVRGVVPIGSIMWDVELEQALASHGRDRVAAAFERHPDNRMYASLDAYLDHWPIRHVRKAQPPFFFLIAEAEQVQPPVLETNSKFVDSARAMANWAEYRVFPGRTHNSMVHMLDEPKDAVFEAIIDFIRRFGGTAGIKD